ncbi:MAG: hypothetical protein OIF48_20635, partial [Silicimonas sp.]|nr:hypothetical protein [Silicimonas sp.]
MFESGASLTEIRVVGDFLATRPSEQASTLGWLEPVLGPVLRSVLGKRLPVVFGAPEGFSQAGFLARVAASGQDGDLHRWFEAAHMTAEAGDL